MGRRLSFMVAKMKDLKIRLQGTTVGRKGRLAITAVALEVASEVVVKAKFHGGEDEGPQDPAPGDDRGKEGTTRDHGGGVGGGIGASGKSSSKESSNKELSGKESSSKESSGKELSGMELFGKELYGKESSGKESCSKESSSKESSGKYFSNKELFGKELSGKELSGKESCGGKHLVEHLVKIRLVVDSEDFVGCNFFEWCIEELIDPPNVVNVEDSSASARNEEVGRSLMKMEESVMKMEERDVEKLKIGCLEKSVVVLENRIKV
ncbi:hypothetical protein LR48_Vigan07g190100 [Vigna angularis]|uniref:Uncharacterized protein n=1 Tax=Phaseolus angularis TaxID=3914 RepID=A0A0L9V022_PHAAN|nr:hypothetical protein LR48_Vigan07g190100 [Vigna angularis]